MTMQSTIETVMQPASAALEAWFPATGTAVRDTSRGALAAEQREVRGAISSTVARMATVLDAVQLDALTDQVTGLLARAEEIRLALALAARVVR